MERTEYFIAENKTIQHDSWGVSGVWKHVNMVRQQKVSARMKNLTPWLDESDSWRTSLGVQSTLEKDCSLTLKTAINSNKTGRLRGERTRLSRGRETINLVFKEKDYCESENTRHRKDKGTIAPRQREIVQREAGEEKLFTGGLGRPREGCRDTSRWRKGSRSTLKKQRPDRRWAALA